MAFNFNPNTTDRSPDLLPVANYQAQAVKMERVWKDSGDFMIKAEFEILAPEDFASRRVFENFNLLHSNETAQKIGREKLADLCDAIGISDQFQGDGIDLEAIEDDALTELFCFKAFDAKIGVQKDKSGQYKDQNRINQYKALGSSEPPRAAAAPPAPQRRADPSTARQTRNEGTAPTTASRPTGAGSRPWDRAAARA